MEAKMFRLKLVALVAAAALLAAPNARASTFYISGTTSNALSFRAPPVPGTFSGTLDIDTSAGSLVSADLTLSGFPDLTGGGVSSVSFELTGAADSATLNLLASTLVGYDGGSFTGFFSYNATSCNLICTIQFANANLSGTITEATPLPAALPLFATGLAGLGLLGWRRKRKAQVVA